MTVIMTCAGHYASAQPVVDEWVLVAGATGGTGKRIVEQLLTQGVKVRALVRDADKGRRILSEDAQLFIADIRDDDAVNRAMEGVSYVFSAIGARTQDDNDSNSGRYVDFEGNRNLVHAAKRVGVKQFIQVSSAGLSASVFAESVKQRPILRWKEKGEKVLRDSGIPYTIIRPGRLLDDPGGKFGIKATQGDYQRASISRDDVASACVQALNRQEAFNKTLEIVNDTAPTALIDWNAFYQALRSGT